MELWIARDAVGNCDLFLYTAKPAWEGLYFHSRNGVLFPVDNEAAPEIQPGECRKFVEAKDE